jgi:hypothetical protein
LFAPKLVTESWSGRADLNLASTLWLKGRQPCDMPLDDPVLFRGEWALFHDIYQQQTCSEGEIGSQMVAP